jgi:propanol-preferring alcohol dehydrogenase
MRSLQLSTPGPVSATSLALAELPPPVLKPGSLLLRVRACGVCHTDLHIVEGDLPPKKLPITPGHQVVAIVEQAGPSTPRSDSPPSPSIGDEIKIGDRVGVPWLYSTCGVCEFCRRGQENLCERAQFTGWDVDGGYAEYLIANKDFVVPIPEIFSDIQAAPLLCAGIVGYRSLRLAEVEPGEHVGLFGFGASAHIVIQLARHWNCSVSVFTRSPQHRALAESLGAAWVGGAEQKPPRPLDRAILFAPAGRLVPLALGHLRQAGTLAINAIHMSPLPEMDYNLLYGERTIRSVANATRRDAQEFMQLAAQIPVQTEVQTFPLEEANRALLMLKQSEIKGAAVLVI